MFRGKFCTGEKLKKYRDYCQIQGAFLGAAISAIGFRLGSGREIAALSGAVLAGLTVVHAHINDGNFEKIDEAIDQAGGENQG